MTDWRNKVDKHFSSVQKQTELDEERKRAKENREEQEYERGVKRLTERFKCCVCGKPSKEPARVARYEPDMGISEPLGSHIVGYDTDLSHPGDLTKCNVCKGWACKKHLKKCDRCGEAVCSNDIYRGVCKKCAEKL